MMNETVVIAFPQLHKRGERLARLGLAMTHHRGAIQMIQWLVVLFYLVVVSVPAFLPLPDADAHIYNNLVLFAQLLFWGIWWPFVILSMFVMGRVWCGVFCPEGALSEWVSRHGLGRAVPRWMKWGGWPFVAFVLTTLYGQLVSVYEYPQAALLVLGGSTVAAIAIGLVYGRGKRVWCRHLCPVSGVFGLLARLAPVQFKVNREQWNQSAQRVHRPIDCAPLIDVRRMTGTSECHMCGRCAGHRDAVALATRLPGSEVASLREHDAKPWEARLVVFGLLGVAFGAFQWSASPWFVSLKQIIAGWLVARDDYTLLQDNAPWWLLTHYPQVNDTFSWLDGLCILFYIGATALLVGGWIWLWLYLAGRSLPGNGHRNRLRLAYALVPLGGVSVFVGLSLLTTSQLQGERVVLPWANDLRLILLVGAALWSLSLARTMVRSAAVTRAHGLAALTMVALAMVSVPALWFVQFRIW